MVSSAVLTLGQWRAASAAALRAVGIAAADMDVRDLAQHATGLSRAQLLGQGDAPITAEMLTRLDALLARRLRFEPMAYILGSAHFYDLSFAVGPGALIPRSDSECLIDLARARAPNARQVLDLGVGPGTLLLTLLYHMPDARGVGVDRAAEALAYARQNAAHLDLADRVAWVHASWADWISDSPFDLIVSNPPYIEAGDIATLQPDVARFEPHGALDGGVDGLDCYRMLAPRIAAALAPGGAAVIEVGAGQARAVEQMFTVAGLGFVESTPDGGGIERALAFQKIPLETA
jgi:release factor glutamine methyltransferase